VNKRFEAYKISRVIRRAGVELEFYRNVRNTYGEQTEDTVSVGTLKCLYHESNGRIEVDRNNSSSAWRNVQSPYATAILDDIKALGLAVEDWCEIGGNKHTIGGIVDVQQWGLIGTISLEVVDNGGV
jgi:phage host-nuclease inhibitor protein Gam